MAVLGYRGSLPLIPIAGASSLLYDYTTHHVTSLLVGKNNLFWHFWTPKTTSGSTQANGDGLCMMPVTVKARWFRIDTNSMNGAGTDLTLMQGTPAESYSTLEVLNIPIVTTGIFEQTDEFEIPEGDYVQIWGNGLGSSGAIFGMQDIEVYLN